MTKPLYNFGLDCVRPLYTSISHLVHSWLFKLNFASHFYFFCVPICLKETSKMRLSSFDFTSIKIQTDKIKTVHLLCLDLSVRAIYCEKGHESHHRWIELYNWITFCNLVFTSFWFILLIFNLNSQRWERSYSCCRRLWKMC